MPSLSFRRRKPAAQPSDSDSESPEPPRPHLLTLPGEIRNQIYAHTILTRRVVPVTSRDRLRQRLEYPPLRPRLPKSSPSNRGHGDGTATPDNTDLPWYQTKRPRKSTPLSCLLPLLLTNSQVHRDAASLFYSQTRFVVLPEHLPPLSTQANLLFRGFLDVIGPRNAACVRYLQGVPFPLNGSALMERVGRRVTRSRGDQDGSEEEEEDADHDGTEAEGEAETAAIDGPGQPHSDSRQAYLDLDPDFAFDFDFQRHTPHLTTTLRSSRAAFLPALAQACPNLISLSFDLRWNNMWIRVLTPYPRTLRAICAPIDTQLRQAFPGLRRIRFELTGQESMWQNHGERRGWNRPQPVTEREWAWVRQALGRGEGVDAGREGEGNGQGERGEEKGLGWEVGMVDHDIEPDVETDEEEEGEERSIYRRSDAANHYWSRDFSQSRPHWEDRMPPVYGPVQAAFTSEIEDAPTRAKYIKANISYALLRVRTRKRRLRRWLGGSQQIV
ncbi:hypothetical protein B0J18DRAFT_76413 [Chaetomium sp. MPI-SDFR-AT-0129]|nr:hypothetical protein B0J18DRAFT_76413 [Chaetomium sp. MPI-SDFR-AT-0129]